MFVKKVPKDMIAPKESIYHLSLKSQKRDITFKINYGLYSKFIQVIYGLFLSQCPLWLKCIWLKRGIIQSNSHIILRQVNHVPYTRYHDPSSSGSPESLLLTRLLFYTKCQSRKRETIQPNIYRILPKPWTHISLLKRLSRYFVDKVS